MLRRFPRRDLDSARDMVSRAEREALDRAEALSRQAADILAVVRRRRDEVDTAGEPERDLEAEADTLRSELEAAERRAEAAESELERLRASMVRPDSAAPAGPDSAAPAGPDGDEEDVAERARQAREAKALIETQLSAEIANMARILDRTRQDLEELLVERSGPPSTEPVVDLRDREAAEETGTVVR